MALIKCPECGKQVSDKAQTCPNCGFSISQLFNDEIMIQIDRDPSQPFLGTIIDIKNAYTGELLVRGNAGSLFTIKSKEPVTITFKATPHKCQKPHYTVGDK